MHSTMMQIDIKNGHAQPIFAHSTETFHDRLGPGPRDDVTTLAL